MATVRNTEMAEMEGSAEVQSCLPVISEVPTQTGEDVTCSVEPPAILSPTDTSARHSATLSLPSQVACSTDSSTGYRLADSKVILSGESDTEGDQGTQSLEKVEIANTHDSSFKVDDIRPTHQLRLFERVSEDKDQPPVKFWALVKKDIWTFQRRRFDALKHFQSDENRVHGNPPDTTALLSRLVPKYFPEELNLGNSYLDPKTWQVGFHVRLLTLSLRRPELFIRTPALLRYTVTKDVQSFCTVLEDQDIRDQFAWIQFSLMVNPDLRAQNTMSSNFEKIAADFFGGKEVLTEAQYDSRPSPNCSRKKTYIITHGGQRKADEVFNFCKTEPKLFRFLSDCLWSGQLEKDRDKKVGPKWVGDGKVTLTNIGPHSENLEMNQMEMVLPSAEASDIMALLQTLSLGQPFMESDEEGTAEEDIAQVNDAPDVIDKDSSSPAGFALPSTDDTEWMKTGNDREIKKVAASSSKKNKKKGYKSSKKGKKDGSASMDEKSLQESLATEPKVREEAEKRASSTERAVAEQLNTFDDPSSDGKWIVVQNKVLARQRRPLNTSNGTSSGPTIAQTGSSSSAPRPQQKHVAQVSPAQASEDQIGTHNKPDTAVSKNNTIRPPRIGPNSKAAGQNVAANKPIEPFKMHNQTPKSFKESRIFSPGEFPALSVRTPCSDVHSRTGEDQNGTAPESPRLATPQATPPNIFTTTSIPGTSVASVDAAAHQPSRVLLTEDEASHVVTTQKVIIRSARYSSNGVALPNFYYVSEDDDSDTEKKDVKPAAKQMSSLEMPSVRSATHSSRTGVALPNFFYVPEHDQDGDIEGTLREPQGRTDRDMPQPLTEFTALCAQCGERTAPTVEARQVICAGCGPVVGVRYCSVACLLVDSLHHASHCVKYPAFDRATYYNLPPHYFTYVSNPITPMLGYMESPERFRQRAFSMYCSSGPFPKLLMAWMKKSTFIHPIEQGMDITEAFKKTGDYTVFRSTALGAGPRNNPNCDVILTIKFHPHDPQKQMLNRVLNACYLVWDHRMIEFLFRLIRHIILDPESFSLFKYTDPVEVVWPEFVYQFRQEFGFDNSMQMIDTPIFSAAQEWLLISKLLLELEIQNPILRQWSRH